MIQDRIKYLRKKMRQEKMDSFLVSKMENIHYLTGYHGHDAWLLVTSSKVYVLTDSRYTEDAERFFSSYRSFMIQIATPRESKISFIQNGVKKEKIRTMGVEAMHLSFGIALHLKKNLKGVDLLPKGDLVELLRMVKSDDEILKIKKAVKLDEKVFQYLQSIVKPGMSEKELVDKCEFHMKVLGGDGSSYGTIAASGTKSALPHAISDHKKIKNNNILLVDMGTTFKGYVSDLTRTFFIGKMTQRFKKYYELVLEAQQLAISLVKPGREISCLEKEVRAFFTKYDLNQYFCHSLGHGIGMEVHELPWVNSRSKTILQENMVITIEPGVYFPGWGGIRIEDDVLVTKKGASVLSRIPKDLKSMNL